MLKALVLLVLAGWVSSGYAQCAGVWETRHPIAGVNGDVLASVIWDSDADGPVPPVVVVAGRFNAAGTIDVHNIAAWDPQTDSWRGVGNEFFRGDVRALAVTSSGQLIAAGDLLADSPNPTPTVARWEGSRWVPVGDPFNAPVRALAILDDGSLVAAGDFSSCGLTPVACVARWDGTQWRSLGQGVSSLASEPPASILSLAPRAGSHVIAAGTFTRAGGNPCNRVALWDGASWLPLGSGVPGGPNTSVRAVAMLNTGECVIGGWFTQAGNVPARNAAAYSFETGAWRSLGLRPSEIVDSLLPLEDGRLLAGCRFGDLLRTRAAAIWDGRTWTPLGYGLDCTVTTLCRIDGNRFFAGGYAGDGQGTAPNVTTLGVWEVTEEGAGRWRAAGSGLSAPAAALLVLPDGDVLCAGEFLVNAVEGPTYGIARFAAASGEWHCLGERPDLPVHALAALPDGGLIAGGEFRQIGGVPASSVARWDGSRWSSLGSGLDGYVRSLACRRVAGGFELVAGGQFRVPSNIARYLSSTGAWTALGPGFDGRVNAVAIDPTGVIYAAGDFIASGAISLHGFGSFVSNATAWATPDSGLQGRVNAMALLPGGGLVIGGDFTHLGGAGLSRNLAMLAAGRWAPVGTGTNGPVWALTPGFGGTTDVIVGGGFTRLDDSPVNGVGRMVGGRAVQIGDGVDGEVRTLATLPDATVLAGGRFSHAGGRISGFVGAWRSSGPFPRILVQPSGGSICEGTSASIHVEVDVPQDDTFQWTRNGLNLMAADPGEAVISGATTSTLQFDGATADACDGVYACRITNLCGSTQTDAVAIVVKPAVVCVSDFNGDGGVDGSDVEAFFVAFESGECTGDVNGDGGIDGGDIEAFFGAWERGACAP